MKKTMGKIIERTLSYLLMVAMVLSLLPAITLSAEATSSTGTISGSTTAGTTLQNGYVYTVSENTTITASAGGNGLTVAAGATVIIVIPKDVTLTVNGGAGSGRTPGGAGIYVPAGATLIVTGEGTLNATGGAGGNGGNGGGGNSAVSNSGGNGGAGGNGGNGGAGGGGAGAGIGTKGGTGGAQTGTGGAGGAHNGSVFTQNMTAGNSGSAGTGSDAMGTLYVLGSIKIKAVGGTSGSSGAAGSGGAGTTGIAGGGGGGAGGGGSTASGIGSGGGGGGAGGGGGGGRYAGNAVEPTYTQGNAGSVASNGVGGKGGNGGKTIEVLTADSGFAGAAGGSGGANGTKGGNGTVYAETTAAVTGSTATPVTSFDIPAAAMATVSFDVNKPEAAGENTVSLSISKTTGTDADPQVETAIFPDGTGGTATLSKTYGEIAYTDDLSTYKGLPSASLSEYLFDGWYTEKDDGAKTTADTVVNSAGAITLYAHWTAVTYAISFDVSGGEGAAPEPLVGVKNASVTLPAAPSCTGYTFDGWLLNGTETKLDASASYEITGDAVFTAQWTPRTYTITLEPNGGSVSSTSVTHTYGTATALPIPTHTNASKMFAGWSGGLGTVYSFSETQKPTGTYTAQWVTANGFTETDTLPGAGGTLYSDRIYRVTSSRTISGSENGLMVGGGTTAIYIAPGCTLTVTGGTGYAGINLPGGSTLIVFGGGTLVANGGSAGNGGNGGDGTNARWTKSPDWWEGGVGGNGGNGGVGAGAGIGTDGGHGGYGGTAGASVSDDNYDDEGSQKNGNGGGSGSSGSYASSSVGSLYVVSGTTLNANGGSAGMGGSAGSAGGNDDDQGSGWNNYYYYGGGGGGGGGGAGGAGASVGTGGRGGGGGGAGGGGGMVATGGNHYGVSSFYPSGGGGGGGASSGSGGSGAGGAGSGSLNGGSGGSGVYANSERRGGSGGSGASGGNSGSYYGYSVGTPGYIRYPITLNGNKLSGETTEPIVANGNLGTFTYGGTLPDTVTVPTRTGYTFSGYFTGSPKTSVGTQYYASSGARTYSTYWAPESSSTPNILDTNKLYAQWEAKTYNITFNGNGSGAWVPSNYDDPSKKSVNFDATFGTLPVPTFTNHIFTDWYTTENVAGEKVSPTTRATTSTLTGVRSATDDAGANNLYARYITLETDIKNASVVYPKSTRSGETQVNTDTGNVMTYTSSNSEQPNLSFKLVANTGYELPESITVTADGQLVDASYNISTGEFAVPLSAVTTDGTGIIKVTAQAAARGCALTLKTVGGTLSGSDYSAAGGYTYTKTVSASETLPIPAAPKGSATVSFGGWYKEPGYTNRVYSVDANAGTDGKLTLYAKWTYSALKEQSDRMYYAYNSDMSDVRGVGTVTKTSYTGWGWNRNPVTSTQTALIQTTYSHRGFEAYYKTGGAGLGGSALSFVTQTGTDIFRQVRGTNLWVAQVMAIEGSYVTINYLIENRGASTVSGFTLGAAADVQINDNDRAAITLVDNGSYAYYQMAEGSGSRDKVFRLYVEGENYGVTDSQHWYGLYSSNANGAYYDGNVFNIGKDSRYSGSNQDSALAYHWTVDIPAGETIVKTVKLGVGDAEEMAKTSVTLKAESGSFSATGNDTLNVTGTAVNINADGTVSADGTSYAAPERDGYVFNGWVYSNGEPATGEVTVDTTVFASWRAGYTRSVTNSSVVETGNAHTIVEGKSITLRYENYDNGSGAKSGYVLQDSTEYGLVNENATFTATLDIADGYLLPQSIEVTSGGEHLTNGTGYIYTTWNNQTRATLIIDADRLKNDIVIKAIGHPAPAQMPDGASVSIPAEQNLAYGYSDDTTLTAKVTPASIDKHTYSYQWYETGSDVNENGEPISGATRATYAFPVGRGAGDYHFYCVVTATRTDNDQKVEIVSNAGTVTVGRATANPSLTMSTDGEKGSKLPDETIGWVYGEEDADPLLTGFNDGEVFYIYYNKNEDGTRGDAVSEGESSRGSKPTLPGNYIVVASFSGDDNTEPFDEECAFTISKGVTPMPGTTGHTDETIDGKRDGTLYGVTDEMQYKLKGESSWLNIKDNATFSAASSTIFGLAPGEYEIRYIAQTNFADGQPYQYQTIATGRKITVTFVFGNGAADTTQKVEWHGDVTYPENPTRDGYSFDGWSILETALDSKIESDKTVTAKWSGGQKELTFDANGGEVTTTTKTVTYGEAYGTLPTPVRTGYSFAGWYKALEDGDSVTAATTASDVEAQTLYAHWTAKSYTVAVSGEATIGASTIAYDAPTSIVITPTGENTIASADKIKVYVGSRELTQGTDYTVAKTTEVETDKTWTVTLTLGGTPGNVTIAVDAAVEKCTLTFATNGGSVIDAVTVNKNTELTLADYSSIKTGYDLEWCSDEALETPVVLNEGNKLVLSADTTIYAKWTANTYTVTFNVNSGTALETDKQTKTVTYDAIYGTMPYPAKPGYIFDGWYTSETGGSRIATGNKVAITAEQTLYAHWSENSVRIQYISDNTTFGVVSSGSEIIKAVNGSPAGSTATAKYGYEFVGWFLSDGTTSAGSAAAFIPTKSNGVYSAATYIAKFKAMDDIAVSFNANYTGAAAINSKTVTYAAKYDDLPTPTRTGYSFAGWYTAVSGGAEVTALTIVSNKDAHTLYAHWNEDADVIISYASEDTAKGTVSVASEAVSPASGVAVGSVATAKTGYTFDGWYDSNGEKVEDDRVSGTKLTPVRTTGDLYAAASYVAKFTKSSFTVTFNTNGSGAVITGEATKSLVYGDAYGTLPTVTRSGYSFDGWYTTSGSGGRQIKATDTMLTGADTTLYAHWTVESYDLTVNVGTNHANITTEGETPFALGTKRILRILPNVGYKLNNANLKIWLGGTDITNIAGLLTRNTTEETEVKLTIDVTALNDKLVGKTIAGAPEKLDDIIIETAVTQIFRNITFNANGGTMPSGVPTSFAMSDGLASLPQPTRTGYEFAGWFTASELTGSAVTASAENRFGKGATNDVTLNAKWTAKTYGVSTASAHVTLDKNEIAFDTATTITVTPTTGYTLDNVKVFVGGVEVTNKTGVTISGGAVALTLSDLTDVAPGAVTVTTATSQSSYVVSFNANYDRAPAVSPETKNVVYGGIYVTLPEPTRTGYSFAGWYTDATNGDEVKNNTPVAITAAQTLYAHWTANSYTLIWNANGGTVSDGTSGQVVFGATITPPTSITRAGYTFKEWSPSVAATMPAANTTYTATWTAKVSTVTFNSDGGTSTTTTKPVTYDALYGALPIPTKTGHTFDGWYTTSNNSGTKVESTTKVANSSDHTLYAHWNVNSYTLTFKPANGNEDIGSTVDFGAAITAPTVTRTGYNFAAWTPAVAATMPAANTTYTATWTAKESTVTFNINGGTAFAEGEETKPVTYDSVYGDLPVPTKPGYTFDGWYTAKTGGDKVESTTAVSITEAQTLYAHWTVKEYSVSATGKITVDKSSVTYGTETAIRVTPDEGNTITEASQIMVYVGSALLGEGYTAASGEDGIWVVTLTLGERPVPGDVTIAVGVITTMYTVTFDANGGTVTTASKTVSDGGSYGTFPTPSKTGYTFDGWFTEETDGTQVTDTTAITQNANHTLYAHWTAQTYTVTFNGGADITVSPATGDVTYGVTYGTLPEPTKEGYTFDGWYDANGNKIEAGDTVNILSNATLTARWTVNSYTLTFKPENGGADIEKTVAYGAAITAPTVTRTGYTFAGWTPKLTEGATVPARDVTYTATWTAQTYAVTFTTDGGSTETGITVTYDGTYGALPTPTKTGYEFAGWYTAQTGGTKVEDTTQVTVTEAQTLYAHWTAKSYTLTWDAGGGVLSGGTAGGNVAFGATVTAPTTKTKTGYSFKEWSPAVAGTMPAENTTYTAVWTENSYTIPTTGTNFTVSEAGGDNEVKFTDDVTLTITPDNGYALNNIGVYVGGVKITPTVTGPDENGNYTISFTLSELNNVEPGEITITAGSEKIYHNVAFDENGGTMPTGVPTRFNEVDGLTVLPAPTKTGYTFAGWFKTDAEGDFTGEKITAIACHTEADASLKAKWTANVYDLRVTTNNANNTVTVKRGDADPTAYTGGETITYDEGSVNITVQAQAGEKITSAVLKIGGIVIANGATITDPTEEAGGKATAEINLVTLAAAEKTPGDVELSVVTETVFYTLTFETDGGTAVLPLTRGVEANNSTNLPSGTAIKLGDYVTIKTGYHATWYTDEGKTTPATDFNLSRNTTLYAGWEANTYTIAFNANGGAGAMEPQIFTYAADETELAANAFTRAGYTFSGWATSPDGAKVHDDEAMVQNLTSVNGETIRLYALWTELQSVTITYEAGANGSVSRNSESLNPATGFAQGATAAADNGYHFDGWYMGDTKVTDTRVDGAKIKPTKTAGVYEQATYTAKFIANSYTVSFNANGGTGAMEEITMTYGTESILTAGAFTRKGYSFAGWATAADGSGRTFADKDTVTSLTTANGGMVTLYALWSLNPTFKISGSVTGDNIASPQVAADASVKLMKGTQLVNGPVTTDSNGQFSFVGVESGVYNVVATKDGITVTVKIDVESSAATNYEISNVTLVLPSKVVNSELEVEATKDPDKAAKIEETVVGDLEKEAKLVSENNADATEVEIKMTVTQLPEDNSSQEQTAIKDKAGDSDSNTKRFEFAEMEVVKKITTGEGTNEEKVPEVETLLEIVIPFDSTEKYGVGVLRHHGDKVEALPSSGNGERYEVGENDITIYAKKFSTYAIVYDTAPPAPDPVPIPGNVKDFKLVFETNGGNAIADEKVKSGTTVDLTKYCPVREGYVFAGWYSDEALTKAVTSVVVKENTTVYAKWTEKTEDTGVDDWLEMDDHIRYMNGYEDGSFRPYGSMTRAEVAQMFYNLLLNKEVTVSAGFTDVDGSEWHAKAVTTLASMKVINGYPDGSFGPDRPITRAEFTAIAMRFAKKTYAHTNSFSDVTSESWYYSDVCGAVNYGWIKGYEDGCFKPNANISRAEAVTVVNAMLQRKADEGFVDGGSAGLISFTDVLKGQWFYYGVMEAANAHDYAKDNGVEAWTALK